MTFLGKGRQNRSKVRFQTRSTMSNSSSRTSENPTHDIPAGSSTLSGFTATAAAEPSSDTGFVIEELSSESDLDDTAWQDEIPSRTIPVTMATADTSSSIPPLFAVYPPIRDALQTKTSIVQDKTVAEVLPFLSTSRYQSTPRNAYDIPSLDRQSHIEFLHEPLQGLSASYTAVDAARPWFLYWCLCGLSTLGEDVSVYRSRLATTARTMQHPGGGFAGGHGQMSHLAPTYAVLLSLALVGGEEAFNVVDRISMWKWLGRLKSSNGGFSMSEGGEEDVRGAYCAVTIISLLNLPVDMPAESRLFDGHSLITGLAEYVSRCQTFEGGIAAKPTIEAHGAYAFCALACLSIIGPPDVIIPKYLDVPALLSWLSARQYGPEGGLAGRTNKLVDGCYSHWVGGCWPIMEAVLRTKANVETSKISKSIYSREGLIRYIMCCCQDPERGGLRDKPSTYSDAYHTCYVLAGLSAAQHHWIQSAPSDISSMSYTDSPTIHSPHPFKDAPYDSGNALASPYYWSPAPNPSYDTEPSGSQVFEESDRVGGLHPVFVIPEGKAEEMRKWFVERVM